MDGQTDRGEWRWFLAWAVVGALGSFGLLAALSIGVLFLGAAGGLVALLLSRYPSSVRGLWGLLAGAAVSAGFLAWTNREGPGEVCHVSATETACSEQWNPWPFAIAAVVMLGLGVALFLRSRRNVRQ